MLIRKVSVFLHATFHTQDRCGSFSPVLNNGYIILNIMYKNDKVIRRYSESFKLKILDELTTGKLNKYQLGKAYGINSSTINEWIKKYNRKDLMNTRVTVKTKDEITRIKQLQKEIEQLKKLLLKKDMDALVDESYLEVAAEQLGYKSVLELKKKLNIKP